MRGGGGCPSWQESPQLTDSKARSSCPGMQEELNKQRLLASTALDIYRCTHQEPLFIGLYHTPGHELGALHS